ncbi:hypothetical protein, partial [Streptomyces sp. SID5606]
PKGAKGEAARDEAPTAQDVTVREEVERPVRRESAAEVLADPAAVEDAVAGGHVTAPAEAAAPAPEAPA